MMPFRPEVWGQVWGIYNQEAFRIGDAMNELRAKALEKASELDPLEVSDLQVRRCSPVARLSASTGGDPRPCWAFPLLRSKLLFVHAKPT
eukprot:6603829-Pyramimonas_sp.AAC.1